MKYEEYVAMRKNMLDEAEALINDGKFDEAEAKANEVTDLDNRFDAQEKAAANMRALAGQQRKVNLQTLNAPQAGVVESTVNVMTKEDAFKSEEYATAWAKVMMGKQLTNDENKAFHMVNEAYTHTTENTPVVIPNTVAAGIWTEIGELYPYFNDVLKTYVKGTITLIKEVSSTDAAWYVESVATADGKELLTSQPLAGCELSRAITISWKLKEMAIPDFLAYIQRKLAEKMGAGLAYGVMNGAGIRDEHAPEPTGIITALKAGSKPQVITYSGQITYKNLTATRALVKSGYAPAVYAKSTTIWNQLANVVDENGRPIFVPDATAGGVYRVLGCVVKEDDSVPEGEVLFSDASRGYQANINKQISVSTEEHVKARTTDYCGYAIADGAPLTLKAHALLVAGE